MRLEALNYWQVMKAYKNGKKGNNTNQKQLLTPQKKRTVYHGYRKYQYRNGQKLKMLYLLLKCIFCAKVSVFVR